MAEIVISIVAKVAELLVVPIGKHICYPFKCQSNIDRLKEQVENLKDVREMVHHSVIEAKNQGDEIEKVVEKWLNRVNDFTQGIENTIIDDEDNAKKRCLIGLCPNLMVRYSLSKKAARTTKDVADLLREGKFEKVSYRPPLQKSASIFIGEYEDFNSRKQIFNDVMEALRNADVNLIGVYGMGGVGKTTLIEKVAWQVEEDKLFDAVVMVVVTETPDIRNIQGQIADKLGLKFQEETLPGRAARLGERMKKENRILVILDNVWAKLDLKSIGIPLVGDEKGSTIQKADQEGENANKRQCKILFTSRNLDVLRDDMDIRKNFKVEILSDTEAKSLFWKTVGYSEAKSDLNRIPDEIVEKCAGLPVAIKTIANALKNKSLPFWKNALDQLKKANPKNIKGMNADVYSTIELSYKFLESEEAKSLFILCSLCYAGYDISIQDLLKYGMGLGLFQDVYTIEEGRNKLHMLIDYLKSSCLLMDGFGSSIRMHDIIHAVAISIASTTKLSFNISDVAGLKELLEEKLPKDSVAISLTFRDIHEIPEKLEFPELELFLLFLSDSSLRIPDAFFEGMKGLKVLDITGIHFLSLPSSLCCLTNLRSLSLDGSRLGDVAIIGKLKKLEFLSFLSSSIEQLPEEIKLLTRLRLLDLTNCAQLRVIKPNVISSLTQLEELLMSNSFVQWEVEGRNNASLAELKQLSRLTTLEIRILDAHIMPQDLFFGKLERYKIIIGHMSNWFDNHYGISRTDGISRTLKLNLGNRNYLGNGFKILYNRTEYLYLDGLKGVKNFLYELDEEGFPQLKRLHIKNVPEIQYIINSVGFGPSTCFPKLESLFLYNLINLEKMCHGQLATEFFMKLRIVQVEGCDRLKNLFSFSMAKNLLRLQEIEVTNCEKLEEIVFKESQEQFQQHNRVSRIEFTQLHTLKLQCLPRLTSFGFKEFTSDIGSQEIVAEDEAGGLTSLFSQNVVLPILKNLELSSINIGCTSLDQLLAMSSCCQTLTSLTLEDCSGNLKFLFSYSKVKSLVLLEKLKILNCKSIEEIIKTEELKEGKVIKMVFPKLINLQLQGLPNLTQFGSGNSFEFPSLTQVSVQNCPRLKIFFSASASADLNFQDDIETTSNALFPILNILELTNLQELTSFCNFVGNSFEFPSLTSLRIENCPNMQTFISNSIGAGMSTRKDNLHTKIQPLFDEKVAFPNLKVLEIKNCAILEAIIVIEEDTKGNTLFPDLYTLLLTDLPKLSCFCNFFGNAIDLPSLATLRIVNCPNMETFISNLTGVEMSTRKDNLHTDIQPLFDEKVRLPNLKFVHFNKMDKLRKIWHHRLTSDSFYALDSLLVYNCHNVLSVFPSNMLGRLQKLDQLCLITCSSLDEIFELQASSSCGKTQAITATQLSKLVLNDLPKLKHIWDVDSHGLLTCQNLISIEVTGCDSLKSIFPASLGRKLLQLEELCIDKCCMVEEIFAKGEEVDDAVPGFPQLTWLRLAELPKLRSFYPRVHISEWPMLKMLEVWKCDKIEISASNFLRFQVTDGESQHEMPAEQPLLLLDKVPFSNLESLGLDWKWFEKEALHEKLPEYSCNLNFLTFKGFHKQADICVYCFLHKLPNLEKLQVSGGFFKGLFLCEGCGCEEEHVEEPSYKLSHLRLVDLFDSLLLWEENSLSSKVFKNLAILEVVDCSNLKSLVPSSVSFQNLRRLEVLKCNELLDLVAIPTAISLVQLTELIVSECKMIEKIIKHEGDKTEDRIIFKNLESLELKCLPSLTSFYLGSYLTEFPSLERVVVIECPNMKIFSLGAVSTPMLHGLQTTEEDGEEFWEGNLNTTIEHLFIENCQSSKEN